MGVESHHLNFPRKMYWVDTIMKIYVELTRTELEEVAESSCPDRQDE